LAERRYNPTARSPTTENGATNQSVSIQAITPAIQTEESDILEIKANDIQAIKQALIRDTLTLLKKRDYT
jgi:hypothetical protein